MKETEVVLGSTEPLVVAIIAVLIIPEALVPSMLRSHPVLNINV